VAWPQLESYGQICRPPGTRQERSQARFEIVRDQLPELFVDKVMGIGLRPTFGKRVREGLHAQGNWLAGFPMKGEKKSIKK
jgi:hypothetical protein